MRAGWWPIRLALVYLGLGCTTLPDAPVTPADGYEPARFEYHIGAGDQLQVVVWRNAALSVRAPVRPDGMITLPLLGDVPAANRTPDELSSLIERKLASLIEEPRVSVIVTNFEGVFAHQVRVIGEAAQPRALTYRRDMTVLDVMIAVGGLTQFANGNRTVLVRTVNGKQMSYRVRLDDLLRDGDTSANIYVLPGDILIIPETFF